LQRDLADARGAGIGVIDASAHAKRGDKTPGPGSVQRQCCGESGNFRGR